MTRTEIGKQFVAAGRCFRCGRTRGARSAWLCDACHEKRLSNERQAREVRVRKGLCIHFGCTEPRVTQTLCAAHRDSDLIASKASKRKK